MEDIHRLTHEKYFAMKAAFYSDIYECNMLLLNQISEEVFISLIKESPTISYMKYIDVFFTDPENYPHLENLYRAMFATMSHECYDSQRFQLARYALLNRSKSWLTDCLLDILTPEYLYDEDIFACLYDIHIHPISNFIVTKLMIMFTGYGLKFNLGRLIDDICVPDNVLEEFCKTNTVDITLD